MSKGRCGPERSPLDVASDRGAALPCVGYLRRTMICRDAPFQTKQTNANHQSVLIYPLRSPRTYVKFSLPALLVLVPPRVIVWVLSSQYRRCRRTKVEHGAARVR